MKKILSLFIGLILIFSVAMPVSAAGLSVKVTASSATVTEGQNVTFTVSLSGAAKATSGSIAVTYPEDAFGFVSGSFSKEKDAAMKKFDTSKNKGSIAFDTDTDFNGSYFVLTLKATTPGADMLDVTFEVILHKTGDDVGSGSASRSVKIDCKTHAYGSYSKKDSSNHTRTCTKCGHVETTAHSWNGGSVTKAATCKETGSKTYTCTKCGASKTETIAKTNDHSFGAWERTKAPTCTTKGQDSRTCKVCGKVETRDVAATGHSFGGFTTVKEASCEGKGEQTRTCMICGVKETKELAALGHSFQNPTVIKQPTCTEPGEESGKCTRCGKETTNKIPATGHKVDVYAVTKDATCTEAGEETGTCTVCGDTDVREIPAKGHTYGEPVVVTPATETSVGKQTKTCTVCGDTVDEEIPMLDTAITSTPDDSQPEGSDSSDTTVDADKNEKTGKALLKVILPLAALAVIGVCAAFFVIRRKR